MMNGLQTLPQWRSYFGNPEGAILGALNAVYPAGKFFAMFLVTWMADRFGRKTTIAIGAFACVAFAIMQGVSQNLHTFIAARAILGFFTSFLAQPSPILVTELAYPTHRGKLTALYNTSFVWATYLFVCVDLVRADMKLHSISEASWPRGAPMALSSFLRHGAGEFHP
jgi:MFS family permease